VQSLVESGALAAEEAERSGYASVLLQALGTGERLAVDVTCQELRRGDVLLLCSDGLSRTVPPHEIAAAAARLADPAALCRALVGAANAAGGPDNVTVVAARVDGPGLQGPREADVVGWSPYTAA
jgi:protein phosphatase